MQFRTKITDLLSSEYAPRTASQYYRVIRDYIRWLYIVKSIDNEDDLLKTGLSDVREWLNTLPIQSARTHNSKVVALSAMYNLIGHPLDLSSLRALDKRSQNHYPFEPVTEFEAQKIILSLKPPHNLILNLMFYSGLSFQEIETVRASDFTDYKLGRADISQWAADRIRIWIEDRQLSGGDLIFQVHPQNLRDALNKRVSRLKLCKNITPLSFRYGGAALMWERGMTDAEVREWLGVSVETLRRYKGRNGTAGSNNKSGFGNNRQNIRRY